MERLYLMGRNAWIIVSDLHESYRNKDNRYDYLKETALVREEIINIGKKYKELGINPKLILLGDVYDRSFKDVTKAALTNNFWILAKSIFTEIYSVLGNHETSFYKDNPFYTLVQNIESTKVKGILNKVWTPLGVLGTIQVPDLITDGNVCFHFNHHNTAVSTAIEGKYNVGLFHQDFVTKEIVDCMKNQFGNTEFITKSTLNLDGTNLLDNYNVCFFGHLHKVYGTWHFKNDLNGKETLLYYLASLGRPNASEVIDSFLERNIPAVIVDDGDFVQIEDNKFYLPSRAECIKETVLQEQQEKRKEYKDNVFERHYKPTTDNPIESLLQRCAQDPQLYTLAEGLLNNPIDELGKEILDTYRKVI